MNQAASEASGALPSDDLIWMEEPLSPIALQWADQFTRATESALKAVSHFPSILAEIEGINVSQGRMANMQLVNGEVLRVHRSADTPKGVLQSASFSQDKVGVWRDLFDVEAFSNSEGRQFELQWEMSPICPGTSRVLMSLLEDGGDEADLREFDLETGQFVEGGFRADKSRAVAAWLNQDAILIGHTATDGKASVTGWPTVARIWRRGQSLKESAPVWEMNAAHSLFMVTSMPGADCAVISESVDYSTTRKHLVTLQGRVFSLDIPNVSMMQSSASRERLICVLNEAAEVDGRIVRPDSLIAVRVNTQTGAARLELVFEPMPAERVDSFLSNLVVSNEALCFAVQSGPRYRVVAATFASGTWETKTLCSMASGESVAVTSTSQELDAVVVMREGFLRAPTQELFYLSGGSVQLAAQPNDDAFTGLVVDVLKATSRDGRQVEYYRVGPKERTGPVPTLMSGYGAFGISVSPGHYSGPNGAYFGGSTMKLWLGRGGALVVPLIRGGGDYGQEFHKVAKRRNRQLSYDDFHATAEHLIESGFTTASMLGVFGMSNGGLLASVVATQRPDLYAAFNSDVPLTDMLRFPAMGMGAAWIDEYGDPANEDDARVLKSYSPVHNVVQGVSYPVALVTVATTDNRVGPGHARKFAKRLMDVGAVTFFLEPSGGGHAVSDSLKRPDMLAMRMAFFVQQLMGAGFKNPTGV